MLRVHFLQPGFTLSDPGMQEAFFGTPLYREFAQLDEFPRLPGESTILRFRHRLKKHKLAEQILATVNDLLTQRGLLLKTGTVVDATLIPAPSSTKNKDKARDPDMHSSKKGEQMYFGMKAHIGADAESGLVHTVRTTWGTVHDVTEGNSLLHGEEVLAYGYVGDQGVAKRPDAKAPVRACEGALPRAQEEYGAALHVVCAVQFVDGARPIDGSASGSVLPNPESTPHSAPNTRQGGKGDGISDPIESKSH